jgi:hemoglobin
MLSTTFLTLTTCGCCWFGCWKPCPQPYYGPQYGPPPAYVVPGPGPGLVGPGPVAMPHVDQSTGAPSTVPAPGKEKSLYERLGGEAAIKAVVDYFVGRAAGDPKVNFTRKGTNAEWKATPENVAHLKQGLVDFVGMATGGPQKYTGHSMKDVHKGMQITQEEFNALAADLKATLDKFKVPAKEQGELLKAVAGTAPDIVEKK